MNNEQFEMLMLLGENVVSSAFILGTLFILVSGLVSIVTLAATVNNR